MLVLVVNLFKLKQISKLVQESRKEKLWENRNLNLIWQLLQQLGLFLSFHRHVKVHIPFVDEKIFYLNLKSLIHFRISIVISNEAKEFAEIVAVIKWGIHQFDSF